MAFLFRCQRVIPGYTEENVSFENKYSADRKAARTEKCSNSTLYRALLLWSPVIIYLPISSVQSLSHVRLFMTPWPAARQASLSITNSRSLLKLMSIKSVMPSSHLFLCHPLLLLPSIFPSIRVFSSESVLHIRCWSFRNSKVLEFQLQHQSFQ